MRHEIASRRSFQAPVITWGARAHPAILALADRGAARRYFRIARRRESLFPFWSGMQAKMSSPGSPSSAKIIHARLKRLSATAQPIPSHKKTMPIPSSTGDKSGCGTACPWCAALYTAPQPISTIPGTPNTKENSTNSRLRLLSRPNSSRKVTSCNPCGCIAQAFFGGLEGRSPIEAHLAICAFAHTTSPNQKCLK